MHNPAACRLARLRERMKEKGIDLCVVPNSDYHGSEYVGEPFRAVRYLTGFSGSAATVVLAPDEAALFTDGRYFIQAERQLAGSGVSLVRAGEEGAPSVEEYIRKKLPEGGRLGVDGRLISARTGEAYEKIAEEKNGSVAAGGDLVNEVWEDRPPMRHGPFFILEERYSGMGAKEKIAAVRAEVRKSGADACFFSSLCAVAWLLNVRGSDLPHVPAVFSYLYLDMETCAWFVSEDVVTDGQRRRMEEEGVTVLPYGQARAHLAGLSGVALLYDPDETSYGMIRSLSEGAVKIPGKNPAEMLKAVKNPVEIENTRLAHVKDGAAVTKFIYWLKTHVGKEKVTERSAAARLQEFRKEQEHYLEDSFDTICAYGANAAMMHYQATEESDAQIEPSGFLLVDSGGHYLEGTTDITRTVALGPLSEAMKKHYTAVLRGNLNLAAAKFLRGCSGESLDILAREPLWREGADYKCGTGHGVGHILSVHEGPNAFRYKRPANGSVSAAFEAGMITTDEPGIYLKGEYGIRIENELLCQKAEKNEYGQFLKFETITYAPFDLDAVRPEDMTGRERELLNAYHEAVRSKLAPYLSEEENLWLKESARAI